jgi:hypothetical protein
MTDTIQALGTGIWRTRDGETIARLPSRHHLTDAALRSKVQAVEKTLARLRAKFDDFTRSGDITGCGCDVPDCPVFTLTPTAASELESLRRKALDLFREAYPDFEESSGW